MRHCEHSGQTRWGTLEDMGLGLSEGLRLPGDTGQVHTHNTQRAPGSHCDPGWSVYREGAEREDFSKGPTVWATLVQEVPLEQVTTPGGSLLPGAAFWGSPPVPAPNTGPQRVS